jgi:hypothetical protein
MELEIPAIIEAAKMAEAFVLPANGLLRVLKLG